MALITGITDNTKNDELKLKIFPNPTSSDATIEFQIKQKQYLQINLCDMQGKIIKKIASQLFTEGEHTLQINTADLSGGSYLIRIQAGNRNIVNTTLLKIEK
jgi:hypothetical protein